MTKRADKRVRCECVRCGTVRYLLPEEIGSLHYTQRDGYVCGPTGRFIQKPKPKARKAVARG